MWSSLQNCTKWMCIFAQIETKRYSTLVISMFACKRMCVCVCFLLSSHHHHWHHHHRLNWKNRLTGYYNGTPFRAGNRFIHLLLLLFFYSYFFFFIRTSAIIIYLFCFAIFLFVCFCVWCMCVCVCAPFRFVRKIRHFIHSFKCIYSSTFKKIFIFKMLSTHFFMICIPN